MAGACRHREAIVGAPYLGTASHNAARKTGDDPLLAGNFFHGGFRTGKGGLPVPAHDQEVSAGNSLYRPVPFLPDVHTFHDGNFPAVPSPYHAPFFIPVPEIVHPYMEPGCGVGKSVEGRSCRGREDALGDPAGNICSHVLLLGTDQDRDPGPAIRRLFRGKEPLDFRLAGTSYLGCGKSRCFNCCLVRPFPGCCRDNDP
eukprot:TRINITY_DN9408_c0_g1_i3.p5 TRINITY_DN9408_c0_g1~~TRINITY_DN9408_c0_g1_i3.p5  ORF type:complete len:200 (+),score=-10.07 TRINITY_DN9408_c0_g1_i3:2041-2640(+)